MKILLVNSHHKPEGGTERYYFNLAKLLRANGHTIAFFSMKDSSNKKTVWSKYFVTNFRFGKGRHNNPIKTAFRIFFSFEAKRKMAALLDRFKPDIVHINNITYFITPSILGEIKKRKIPILMTVHDYQILSPNPILFADKKVSDTSNGDYLKVFFKKEIKHSYYASLLAVVAFYIQHIFQFYKRYVDLFICPSIFMKNKLIECGFDKKRIIYLPNFMDPQIRESMQKNAKKYALFFGRINMNKGVGLLLKLAKKNPKLYIKIIGNWDDVKLKQKISSYLTTKEANIDMINYQNESSLYRYISQCEFVIVPSLWYENQPYSIMEAYAFDKAVLASKIGGIPEIVKDGVTGYLFDPDNFASLKRKASAMWKNNKLTLKLGENARSYLENNFDSNYYYLNIIAQYKKLSTS